MSKKKFNLEFNYISRGEIEVEAENLEFAIRKAREQLEQLRELGMMSDPNSEEIVWTDDYVEVL